MAEAHHARKGNKPCDVKGCEAEAERSISGDAADDAGLKVAEGLKRVHLCKQHYKEYKKLSKNGREIETLGR
ncbi:MAG: hypothetical protein NT131_04050 [Methanomassiliicoccales archaeon]|nr:hypothetical protein [Methanomassiliicoccales archaeon]